MRAEHERVTRAAWIALAAAASATSSRVAACGSRAVRRPTQSASAS